MQAVPLRLLVHAPGRVTPGVSRSARRKPAPQRDMPFEIPLPEFTSPFDGLRDIRLHDPHARGAFRHLRRERQSPDTTTPDQCQNKK